MIEMTKSEVTEGEDVNSTLSLEDQVISTNGEVVSEPTAEEESPDHDIVVPAPPLPSIQYTREQMLLLEKSDFSLLRPVYLDIQFDRDGRWDPMAWHAGKPSSELESVPVGTLEFRKRTRSNAADTSKEVEVVLSPQRMSFTGGCAGTKHPPGGVGAALVAVSGAGAGAGDGTQRRPNGLPTKSKYDKGTDSTRSRDPEREKHLQKVNGNYSGNREQIRKAIRDLHENRDRQKELKDDTEDSPWVRNGEYTKQQPTKETKYNSCNGNGGSSKRQYNPRRISEKSVDDVPEWFAEGPTSRLDTIELKGFEDDDNAHSIEAADTKDSKSRDNELAMDPLGNASMTSNQYNNDSMYSTGLQEDWDPTNPKFNMDALLDPTAFVEGGKDLLEVEKSLNLGNGNNILDYWAAEVGGGVMGGVGSMPNSRPNSSPGGMQLGKAPPRADNSATVPFSTAEVHFGDNNATSSLKAMLGVNFGDLSKVTGNGPIIPGPPPLANGMRPPINLEDPLIQQLLNKDKQPPLHPTIKPPITDIPMSPALLQQLSSLPPNIREAFLQRSQSEQLPPPPPPGGGIMPHPSHVFSPGRPGVTTDPLFRDPRLVEPRLFDPRLAKSDHLNLISPQAVKPVPKASQDLLKSVKNDPIQLDKVINHLQTQLKLGRAPAEAAPALHDKTQALKELLRLPGPNPLMTAPARIAPVPPPMPQVPITRPRIPHEEAIPTRITSHDHRNAMPGSRPGFPMAFTPTSVMIRSQEFRNLMRHPSEDNRAGPIMPPHPPHMQGLRGVGPPPQINKSPRFDDEPRPVPTIETSRSAVPKLHFPNTQIQPANFSPHHAMKGGIPPFLLQQPGLNTPIDPSPKLAHSPQQLTPSQLAMHPPLLPVNPLQPGKVNGFR